MNLPKAIKAIKSLDVQTFLAKQKAYEQSILNIPLSDPWVTITLGQQDFKLEYSYAATCDVFRITGKSIFKSELTDKDLVDPELMIKVLVAGLATHHPDITFEDVAKLITMKHRMYYLHRMKQSWEVTQPDYEQLASVIGDMQELTAQIEQLEAGDTSAPLPEITDSPISGEPADL